MRRGGDPLPAGTWGTGVPSLDALLADEAAPAPAGTSGLARDGAPGSTAYLPAGGFRAPGSSPPLPASGGFPRGRLSVLAGERRSGAGATGRLTLLQALLAAASRSMQAAYVDLPGTLDPGFLADLGADLDACLVVRPPGGAPGPGLAMARALVRAGVPWVGVAFGGARVAAATWEHPLTALVDAVWAARAVACVSAPAPLAAPLAYASSLTLGCSPLGWQESHGDVVGLRLRLQVVKSKVGAPGGSAAVLLRYPRPHAVGDVVGLPSLLPGTRTGESAVAVRPTASVAAAG